MIHTDIGKSEDAEVLEELYTAYAQKLLSVCRRYVKDEDVAQDILHDAFIIIFTSFGSLKNKTHPEGWMTTIVRNLCLKYLQSTGRQPLALSAVDTETLPEEQPDNAEKISLDRLWTAIESLPKGHREVFKLAVLDGLSHKEIGRMLGIAPHSSSSQLSRAKKMLRQLLAHYRLLLLVPVLVAVYLYFNTSSESDDLTANKPAIIQQQPENRLQMARKQPARRPEKAMSLHSKKGRGQLRVVAKRVEEKPSVVVAQNPIDSVSVASPVSNIHADSLQRHLRQPEQCIFCFCTCRP
ncbi:MAG: sigma-70 family RNA polymerase sigma factor, partial [Prevotella sp.]